LRSMLPRRPGGETAGILPDCAVGAAMDRRKLGAADIEVLVHLLHPLIIRGQRPAPTAGITSSSAGTPSGTLMPAHSNTRSYCGSRSNIYVRPKRKSRVKTRLS